MSHLCHAVSCNLLVPPRRLFCLRHWRSLPKPAQRVIWYYYRPGQEIDKDASPSYLLAQACAVAIVAFKDKTWGSLKALNHVASASGHAQQDGLDLTRIGEIIKSMGCDILAR